MYYAVLKGLKYDAFIKALCYSLIHCCEFVANVVVWETLARILARIKTFRFLRVQSHVHSSGSPLIIAGLCTYSRTGAVAGSVSGGDFSIQTLVLQTGVGSVLPCSCLTLSKKNIDVNIMVVHNVWLQHNRLLQICWGLYLELTWNSNVLKQSSLLM